MVTPTAELAEQLARVFRRLGNALRFRTALTTSSKTDRDSDLMTLRIGPDVLVSTPGRLIGLLAAKDVDLSRVTAVVLDEADVLIEETSFPLKQIGESTPSSTQFIFSTATLPKKIEEQIQLEFPGVIIIHGPGLHRIVPSTTVNVVECSHSPDGDSGVINKEDFFRNKCTAMLTAVRSVPSERTLIFCNSILQCRDIENFLKRKHKLLSCGSLPAILSYHGAINETRRWANIKHFSRYIDFMISAQIK